MSTARALELGKADRPEATTEAQRDLGDSYPHTARGKHARLGNFQSGDRQQASGVRSHEAASLGRLPRLARGGLSRFPNHGRALAFARQAVPFNRQNNIAPAVQITASGSSFFFLAALD